MYDANLNPSMLLPTAADATVVALTEVEPAVDAAVVSVTEVEPAAEAAVVSAAEVEPTVEAAVESGVAVAVAVESAAAVLALSLPHAEAIKVSPTAIVASFENRVVFIFPLVVGQSNPHGCSQPVVQS